MGTFAETANVDCQLRKNNRPFSISISSKQAEVAVSVFCLYKTNSSYSFPSAKFQKRRDMDMETRRHGDTETSNGKPRDFP
jgi:hypothetical protein